MERYEEALESFNKAIEISSDYEEAMVGKADMEKVIAFLNQKELQLEAPEKIPSN